MMRQFDDDGLNTLLERLLALPHGARAAALDTACASNPALRPRVERLLALAESEAGFLDRSPFGKAAPSIIHGTADAAGRIVGAYRLLRRIGTGGMAEVWLAERIEGGFRQQVAVKLAAHAPGRDGARFAAEREILASLAHPGIARLHDGGVAPDGLAWMAMEYVEGEHLTAWCQAREALLEQRLALFLQVCDAVAYAHTRLVVHRDIKPANILVTAEGQAKLLDFGIAKLLDGDTAADPGYATSTLQLSPSYAAPEQLGGRLVGTPTDVYALGVTLFELLVGRLPWADEATPLATAMRRLADTEPPVPSRSVAASWPIPARALRGDLDAIVSRALRRESVQRYPDARTLAEDIRRHLQHRPVQARAGVRGYVARRTLRRHWRGLALTAAVFVAMSATLAAITWQARKAGLAAQRAEAVQSFMVDLFRTNSSNQADPVKARQTTARELLDIGAKRIETRLDDAPENKLALLRLFGSLYDEFALSSEQVPVRQQAVALSRRIHGMHSPELASDLVALARAVRDHDQAERLIAEAGAILDRRHDADSSLRGRLLLAEAANNASNDLKRARAAAAKGASILGAFPESTELAETLYILGTAMCGDGDYADAIAPLTRAVEISIRVLGVPNPRLSAYYEQLGTAQAFTNRYPEAEASIAKAIEQAHENKAEYDYDRVQAQTTMALVLFNEDKPVRSLEFAAQAQAGAPAAKEGADAALLRAYIFDTASRSRLGAGEPEGALSDAEAAIELSRIHDSEGLTLVSALQRRTEALIELGQLAQAADTVQEAVNVLQHARPQPSTLNTMLQIDIALAKGDLAQARALFATMPPGGDVSTVTPKSSRRNLFAARIHLAGNDHASAARLAGAALEQMRASKQAPYLRIEIADGEVLEGLARLRGGDAAGARPLLADALAIRSDLLLPTSPKIAEAQLALAECALALGHRDQATRLVAQAEAIQKQHAALSTRYREPLQRLRATLAQR